MRFDFTAVIDGINCRIHTTGSSVIPDDTASRSPHKHYSMELHCVFSGEETVFLPSDRRRIRVRPGQILLLPREVFHGVTTDDTPVERLCFNFSAEPADKKTGPILELYTGIRDVLIFENPNNGFFAEQCRLLHSEQSFPLAQEQLGTLLLSTALRLLSSTATAQTLPPIQPSRATQQKWVIEEYIEGHFTDDTGIAGLAQALYLSQRQTRTLVRRFLGEDYKTVIIRRRMELAEFFLRDPERSLEEIAWQVGYRSYSGFQLCFKKHFGITPSQMRQQILK